MVATVYANGTEWIACQIAMTRGTFADITQVGVAFTTDSTVPTVAAFTTDTTTNVKKVDGTVTPLPSLAEHGKIDVLALVGAGGIALPAGDQNMWVLVDTTSEQVIRKAGTVTVI